MQKLFLIDGNALVHRAFHALPSLTSPQGEEVNAVYGFFSMILHLLNDQKPTHLAFAFDTAVKTFRHERYDKYKATRVKAPDSLYAQFPLIRDILATSGLAVFTCDGFEADDLLGTISASVTLTRPDCEIMIVTGDMDALQLIGGKVKVMAPAGGFRNYTLYDREKVFAKYGLNPPQISDLKGLQGDSSDNIKGVRGVGPKTARDLLNRYGDLAGIYRNLTEICAEKPSLGEKLRYGEKDAFFSKELATIHLEVPITFDFDNTSLVNFNADRARIIFIEHGFESLLKRLNEFDKFLRSQSLILNQIQQQLF